MKMINSPKYLHCLLYFVVLFILASNTTTYAIKILRTARVRIINELSDNKILEAHCRSGGDDRGSHYILAHESYEFKFTTMYSPDSKFHCQIWDLKAFRDISFIGYNIRDDKLIKDICGDIHICEWFANINGLYVHNVKTGEYIFMYKWEDIQSLGNTNITPQAAISPKTI
ncbi:hypothetical protein ACFE04_006012 [Oxalis oulophora]